MQNILTKIYYVKLSSGGEGVQDLSIRIIMATAVYVICRNSSHGVKMYKSMDVPIYILSIQTFIIENSQENQIR